MYVWKYIIQMKPLKSYPRGLHSKFAENLDGQIQETKCVKKMISYKF